MFQIKKSNDELQNTHKMFRIQNMGHGLLREVGGAYILNNLKYFSQIFFMQIHEHMDQPFFYSYFPKMGGPVLMKQMMTFVCTGNTNKYRQLPYTLFSKWTPLA